MHRWIEGRRKIIIAIIGVFASAAKAKLTAALNITDSG
jgi:hypothetical protein